MSKWEACARRRRLKCALVLVSTISMSSSRTVCRRAPPKRCLIWREKVAFPHFTGCNHVQFSMNPYFSVEKYSYDRFLGLSGICFMGFFAFFCAEVRCKAWSSMTIGHTGRSPHLPPKNRLCRTGDTHSRLPQHCTCYGAARSVSRHGFLSLSQAGHPARQLA